MLNLKTRTEYSFRKAYGPIQKVVECFEGKAVGICDTGTWGHVAFSKHCKKAGIKPVFGAEISVVLDATDRSKQADNPMGFLACNNDGLAEIYELVSRSTSS